MSKVLFSGVSFSVSSGGRMGTQSAERSASDISAAETKEVINLKWLNIQK